MEGRHSLVPKDWELVRQDNSSSVGTIRGGLVGISSSPAGSSPHHQGNGSHSFHGCVQRGLGSPVRLTLHIRHRDCGQYLKDRVTSTFWRCRPSSTPWETSFLIWGQEWCAWYATTHWQWLTSRMREALDPILSCSWCCACWSGAIARQ